MSVCMNFCGIYGWWVDSLRFSRFTY